MPPKSARLEMNDQIRLLHLAERSPYSVPPCRYTPVLSHGKSVATMRLYGNSEAGCLATRSLGVIHARSAAEKHFEDIVDFFFVIADGFEAMLLQPILDGLEGLFVQLRIAFHRIERLE